MAMGCALLVSADPVIIPQFGHALQEFSISYQVCRDAGTALLLLNNRKFDVVIVDLQLGEPSRLILDEVHLSPSNKTAVTFVINDAKDIISRDKSMFAFQRPLFAQSISNTFKAAYGLILRERRRYFRCIISIPVVIVAQTKFEFRCRAVNVSEGGMSLISAVPVTTGTSVFAQFTLPDHEVPFLAESTIRWWAAVEFGIRFVHLAHEHKTELQRWLAQKLEETLPESIARKFSQAELRTKL